METVTRMKALLALWAVLAPMILGGCGETSSGAGTLEVRANGEDFVREGFETKDGWEMSFDHVYVTLFDITAYQSDPPYDPDRGEEVEAGEEVVLEGPYTVDLAEGGADAATIEVGTVEGAPEGLYNALSWRMAEAETGPTEGASVMVIGTARKDGESIDFILPVNEEYDYICGEFVGDERKGVLEDGGAAYLEATFHFDHIFGDGEAPPDDDINTGAIGFEPFAELAGDGSLEADLQELELELSPEDHELLEAELPTLGHTGEGHCLETNSGATG
ncbi:MAG: DUF4382 domain-containing protein [Rubrobacteraceae bacterium]